MHALGYSRHDQPLTEFQADIPAPGPHDLLVSVDAIAVNPVDIKVKAGIQETLPRPKIPGWDACATVIETGSACSRFKAGDQVMYAGDMTRDGCYATHQLVDERITGPKPASLTATEAAALPLTGLTAYEALFSRLRIDTEKDSDKTLLIIAGAGGVGSMAIQLAKLLTGMRVVATASRPASRDWCQQLGADHIVDHQQLAQNYQQSGLPAPDYILCAADSDDYFETMAELIAPQGLICLLTNANRNYDLNLLKIKSAGVVWEFMFTRPVSDTDDLKAQQQILETLAALVDKGQLKTTLTETLGPLTLANIQRAHEHLLSGKTIGKIALTGYAESAFT